MSEKQAAKRDKSHEGSSPRTCRARPLRRRSLPAPVRDTIGASKQCGRGALERPRPDTGGTISHALSAYRCRNLEGFPPGSSR